MTRGTQKRLDVARRVAARAIVGIVLGTASGLRAADALETFKFEGMAFATSLAEFQRRYPSAYPNRDHFDEKLGLKCYLVANIKVCDGAMFMFFDDRLYGIQVLYDPPRVAKIGGIVEITRKLSEAFGPSDSYDAGTTEVSISWIRPEVHRRANWTIHTDRACLTVVDTLVDDTMKKRQAKHAELGF